MKLINRKVTAMAAAMSLAVTASVSMAATPYEVWGSDQSNSTAEEGDDRGTSGSYLWIWNSEDVNTQIGGGAAAEAIGCDGANKAGDGPCDLYDVFPGKLKEVTSMGATGNKLSDLPNFGRLHGMLPDPQNEYMNINAFAPGAGYVGIVDGYTKEAVALFRVTETSAGRSLHMSFWNSDGSALLLANLHGRILERIDIKRNKKGRIVEAVFNKNASLAVADISIVSEATAFTGKNAHGNKLVSSVKGNYKNADLGTTTPTGALRQGPGRGGNVIVCPIVSGSDKVYITFGGGGLLVADGTTTPMSIIGEYTNSVINGAGCGGVQVGDQVYLNAGASAAPAGREQSMMKVYAIDDTLVGVGYPGVIGADMPAPTLVYSDTLTNTNSGGNTDGTAGPNTSGQLPGTTTRRDAHGMVRTNNGLYIHQADRLQNNVEVISTASMSQVGSYDLTSVDGQGGGVGTPACEAASVTDDSGLPSNDPAPDLMGATPDGDYLVVATRGPSPVSVGGNAQGSCPGVGIIGLSATGHSGSLVTVLRTTNTVDQTDVSAPNGHAYTGAERSDIHGASVRVRVEDM